MFAVLGLCSSEFKQHRLEISMNSRSDWLEFEAEHYQHCYQRMENAFPCLCLGYTNGQYFEYLLWAVAQLNK